MRLIDLVLREKLEAEQRKALGWCTNIAADNVADYLDGSGKMNWDDIRSLPNIAPPFRDMFIDMKVKKPIGMVGWYFHAFDLTDKDHYAPVTEVDDSDLEGVRWMLRGYWYSAIDPKRPHAWCQVFVSADGHLHTVKRNWPYIFRASPGGMFDRKDRDDSWMKAISYCLNVTLWTLCFLNTKNVVVEDLERSEKLRKAHQKRYHTPLNEYKVLKIMPMRSKKEVDELGGQHSTPRYHIARGHFKTFTDDAPLFGKVVGTYWWDQQLRGKRERGEIRKDYEIELKAEAE